MKKNPLFVAVSNQKGGVGKSTMLVTLASLLNYSMGKNVAIVDCDATQRSLFNLRGTGHGDGGDKQKVHDVAGGTEAQGMQDLSYQAGKAGECTPGGRRVGGKSRF